MPVGIELGLGCFEFFKGKITINIAKREFDRLEGGDHVTNRDGEIFTIDMEYVLGPPVQIFSAILQSGEKYQPIRISEGIFQFYERIFPC